MESQAYWRVPKLPHPEQYEVSFDRCTFYNVGPHNDELLISFVNIIHSILIVDKSFENLTNLQTEPWHNTKYKVQTIPTDLIDKVGTLSKTKKFLYCRRWRYVIGSNSKFLVSDVEYH